ncbi:CoA transferase [Acinetobacter sp. C_4_1]|nr:CoA transferase [Acinetobacter sp. F_3_1]MCT8098080.1 CoA transferase [Acinetobacter sp. C_3_1]MCT8100764.1 CoA transferase [Acinetobacter sp. C_4_1]MCT8134517.1 CoA transferase [Acinetobacter sp. T_3_1]
MLAGWGAGVIKVERPQTGDELKRLTSRVLLIES